MRKSTFLSGAFAFILINAFFAAYASASTTYSYYYVAGQSAYSVAAGSDIVVPLYLEEVNSDQSTNSLLASEHGLSAAGADVSLFSGSTNSILIGAAANTGVVPDGFDDPTSSGAVNSITSATITESTDPEPFGTDLVGVEATSQTNGVSEVYLGSVTIQASALSGETTVFTVASSDAVDGATFTNDNNYDLDNDIDPINPPGASDLYFSAASTNFTVTTTPSVPEPVSLCILGFVGIGFCGRRHSGRVRRYQI